MYGVGVHGAGGISAAHIDAYKNNPETKIIGISDIDHLKCEARAREAGLRDVKFYTDYDEMLDNFDIDIISVCTPPQFTSRYAVKAAEAGKHVLIEKPVATSLTQLQKMYNAIKKTGIKTCVSFVARWNPLVNTVKDMISTDFIGEVYYLETDYHNRLGEWYSGWEWARRKDSGKSAFFVGGIHGIDLARWFAGSDRYKAANITEVVAVSGGYRAERERESLEYDGLEVMIVKFDTGFIAKIRVDFDVFMPYGVDWSIFGDKGTIKTNRVWSWKFPDQNKWIKVEAPSLVASNMGELPPFNFRGMIDHFINCIMEGKESPQNLEDAVNSHEAALAALQSYAKNNIPIKLPL